MGTYIILERCHAHSIISVTSVNLIFFAPGSLQLLNARHYQCCVAGEYLILYRKKLDANIQVPIDHPRSYRIY